MFHGRLHGASAALRRVGAVCALVTLGALAVASPASASIVSLSFDGDAVFISGDDSGPADTDFVTVSLSGGTITVTDTGAGGATASSGPPGGCTQVNPTTVTCPADPPDPGTPPFPRGPVREISAFLGGDNDTFTTSAPFDASVNGGDGNDALQGGPNRDNLSGGEGDDILNGGDGDDDLEGGGGADSPGGNDILIGAGGTDEAVYSRAVSVAVSLNGLADDGQAGEADNVQTEVVRGGFGNDLLVGDNGPNTLIGRDGADILAGLDGTDALRGRNGDDVLNGGKGRDDLECDIGLDIALADGDDVVLADCERAGARITGETASVKRNKTRVAVECPAAETVTCKGKVKLLSDGKKVGTGKFKIGDGKTKRAKVKLNKKGAKELSSAGGSLLVTAQARTTEPFGSSVSEERLLLTRAPKKRK
jgi:Ca2+-binding RTX toxin-like protein